MQVSTRDVRLLTDAQLGDEKRELVGHINENGGGADKRGRLAAVATEIERRGKLRQEEVHRG